MRRATVTVGWTKPAPGYSPFSDGYRPGAAQHELELELDVPEGVEPWELAEAAFAATNAPEGVLRPGTVAAQLAAAIAESGYRGAEAGHFSLSVGDTVAVGEVLFACAPRGWERVRAVA